MKRLISAICIFAMLFQPIIRAETAENTNVYNLVYDLGILAEETSVSDNITYDEIARAALVITAGGAVESEDYLALAKDSGLVKETAEGNVNAEDAVKILLRSAGYISADLQMENAMFKMSAGNSITKGVIFKDRSTVRVSEVCKMIENLLEEDTLRYNGTAYVESGDTVLEDNFKINKKDGILYPGTMRKLHSSKVIIGTSTYTTKKDFSEYAGKMVRAYIDNDGNVVSVTDKHHDNREFIISANDIVTVGTQSISIYDENRRIKELHIRPGATEVYNGEICNFKSSDLKISNGFISLIQHPGSNMYDVVIIKQYDIMVVGGVGNGVAYDYHANGANIRLEGSNLEVTLTFEGKTAQISDIQRYDVLFIMYTKDKQRLWVEIVRNSASGTISELSDEHIKVGRRSYPLSSYFKQYSEKPVLGEEIDLILDSAGFAVAIKKGLNVNSQYAYFMGLYPSSNDDVYRIRLLTEDGTIKKMEFRDKVTVDGRVLKNDGSRIGDFVDSFKKLVEVSTAGVRTVRNVNDYVYQLVIYSTDSEGKIKKIDTAVENPEEAGNEDQLIYNESINKNARYKAYPMQFVDRFGMSGKFTKVFYVPAFDNVFDEFGNLDLAKRRAATLKDYEVATPGILTNDEDDAIVAAYNITRGGVASAVVLYNENVGAAREFTDKSAGLFILAKKNLVLNSDQETCYELQGFLNGEEVTYYMNMDDYGRYEGSGSNPPFVEPQVNDIMQIKADKDNNVVNYSTRYRPEGNINFYGNVGNDLWSEFGNYSAYVYDQDEYGIVTVSDVNTRANERIIMKSALGNVMIYDMFNHTVRKGTADDVISYVASSHNASKIYVRGSYGVIGTMIVFVNEEGDQ